jgi:hypothetical protein
MNRLAFILVFYSLAVFQVPAQSLAEIRSIFYEAVKDPSSPDKYKLVPEVNKSAYPIVYAYIGGLKTMMANTVTNPYKKLKYFNEGKELIEKAVAADNREWEIRFVRFMIQCKIPSFLLYNNIDEDKKIILEAMRNTNISGNSVKKIALQFLEDCGKLDKRELASLKK